MSLINCSECGKEVSDKAVSCPDCGNPINATLDNASDQGIRCPKCSSKDLHTDKKGFSGKKAVAGAILTGGIGLVAGTIGSNSVVITCLKCGHKFNAGDALIASPSNLDDTDKRILEISKIKGKLSAVKFCKEANGWGLAASKDYVDNLVKTKSDENKLAGVTKNKPQGCFIATACYGDYDSKEVVTLRKYRDNVMLKTSVGSSFVKFYYFVSPPMANAISKSEKSKNFIREFILNPIVRKLDKRL